MDVLQPPGEATHAAGIIDSLKFQNMGNRDHTLPKPGKIDIDTQRKETGNVLRLYPDYDMQRIRSSADNEGHFKNGDGTRQSRKDLRQDAKYSNKIAQFEESPKSCLKCNSLTAANEAQPKIANATVKETPAALFVPGAGMPSEMIKMYDHELGNVIGWRVMPLPVYRTQHALHAAYAEAFSHYSV